MKWKTYNRCFKNKYMGVYFLKIAPRTQETEKLRSWTYLFKNNQANKFTISSTQRTHVHDLSRPGCAWEY